MTSTTHPISPTSASSLLSKAPTELVVTATLLVGSASVLALSLGDPELITVVACLGLAVTAVGAVVLAVNECHGTVETPRSATVVRALRVVDRAFSR